MVVWQAHDRNEWDVAIRQALAEPGGPTAVADEGPDPFSLADPTTVEGILRAAGFADIGVTDVDEPIYYGPGTTAALWIAPTQVDLMGRTGVGPVVLEGPTPRRCATGRGEAGALRHETACTTRGSPHDPARGLAADSARSVPLARRVKVVECRGGSWYMEPHCARYFVHTAQRS